ncbi:DNA-binding transcriptional ArsR family regulator [Bacillus sp. RC97]|uniref:hypothetical protein n=1 Tax=Bacillus TaxID=1386 RepID=UPI003833814E
MTTLNGIMELVTTDGELLSIEELRTQIIAEHEATKTSQRDAILAKRERELRREKDKRTFYKVARKIVSTNDTLKSADLGVVLRLMQHLYYGNDGLLSNDSGRNGENPATVANMMKSLGKSRRGLVHVLDRLENAGIIKVDRSRKTAKYYINEELIACGKGVNMEKDFVKVYKTHTSKVLDRLTDTEAGIIFKLMPYIHVSTYMLVENPDEMDLSKVKHLPVARLAEIVGLEYKSFTNKLRGIVRKGALAKISCGITALKGDAYALNPRIVDRGYISEVTDALTGIFDTLEERVSSK